LPRLLHGSQGPARDVVFGHGRVQQALGDVQLDQPAFQKGVPKLPRLCPSHWSICAKKAPNYRQIDVEEAENDTSAEIFVQILFLLIYSIFFKF
jgi:hypothetical protein